MKILKATTPLHISEARKLFQKYADWINVDLGFQHFEQELAEIDTIYGPPTGSLLLVKMENKYVGCVAVRPIEGDICEMKRLYTDDAYRGMGIGRLLIAGIITEARELNYQRMRLDTLASMTAARKLYKSFGFQEIPAYYHNPLDDVVFMELNLTEDVLDG